MSKKDWAKKNATKVVSLTIEEAKKLPNMLGKIVPVQLSECGWYAHNSAGNIIYYEKA